MKTNLLSLFAGAALTGGVAVAQAGEPITLDSSQLDKVTAGAAAGGAAGPNQASVGAAHNLGIASSGGVTGINFSSNLIRSGTSAGSASAGSPTTDVVVAEAH